MRRVTTRVDRLTALVVAALTVLAFVLRAVLVRDNLWGDELYLYDAVAGNSLGEMFRVVRATESTPPLYFLAAWVADRVGGEGLAWVRVPSMLAGTATVPLVYLLGVRTVGRGGALIGAALFAIAPFLVFYGSEGRGYSMLALLCVASTLALLELVRTGRRAWAVALAITTAAAAYTHYLAVFVLLAQLVWALWFHRERARQVAAGYAGAALLYVPWIPGALEQVRGNTSERVDPLGSLGQAVEWVVDTWVGHPFTTLGEIPGRVALVVIGVGLLVAAAFGLRDARVRGARPGRRTVLVVALAGVTPLAALLYELGPNSLAFSRYLSASVPYAMLAIGALLTAPRRLLVVGLTAVAVLGGVAAGTVQALDPDARRPDYRAAARHLDRIAAPQEPVVELNIFRGPPGRNLGYYFGAPHVYYWTGQPVDGAFAAARDAGRVHLLIPEGAVDIFLELLGMEERGFELAGREVFSGSSRLVLLTYEPS
jgi:uncharacterized membrane protein